MYDRMRRALRPRTDVEHRDQFGERIDRDPEPKHVRPIAQACAQFIKLEMRQLEVADPAVVQGGAVLASPRQPGADRAFPVSKHAHGCGDAQPSGSAEAS